MTFASRTECTRDDWQTPLELVHALGRFDLDPCANCRAPTRVAAKGFTKDDDGLAQQWAGRVFLNPPYGTEPRVWLRKLAEHGNGIALIPPRVGARWFHREVFATADAILFLCGRLAFINPDTGKPVKGNNADSILVAYGQANVDALLTSGLEGEPWLPRLAEPLRRAA